MVKRIYSILQLFFVISTSVSAIVIFYYAYFFLQNQGKTETKIEENVVLRFNIPTEYLQEEAFWWLLEGSNTINIVNFSNENHKGSIKIDLQQNPCSNFQAAKYSNQIIEFDKKQDRLSVREDFLIGPYEKKSLDLEIFNSGKCLVDNGDPREFGAKIVGWTIQ
jgi:hypothetical protein